MNNVRKLRDFRKSPKVLGNFIDLEIPSVREQYGLDHELAPCCRRVNRIHRAFAKKSIRKLYERYLSLVLGCRAGAKEAFHLMSQYSD